MEGIHGEVSQHRPVCNFQVISVLKVGYDKQSQVLGLLGRPSYALSHGLTCIPDSSLRFRNVSYLFPFIRRVT